ncbi:peptidylprolyl isomerase [bacterium]|nr:peptidylprolyl isomerase [bacterium]
MLMSSMREKTKIVLFVALLAFVGLIFFDWGMQKSGSGGRGSGAVIAKVNDQEIPWETYQRVRQQTVADFESRTGRTAEDSDYDAIEEEAWIKLVRQAVVQEEVEKHHIVITDAEILATLHSNPPPAVRASFTNEAGEFDVAAYTRALGDPSMAPQWAAVEQYLRDALPPDKIQNYVGLAARVTSGELRARFLDRNEKVKVKYVTSSPARMEVGEDDLSDDDYQAYYRAHSADYEADERVILQYVRVPKTASAEDSTATHDDLALFLQDARDGQDFADLARNWSEDGSAERGGDLGWVARGDMVPEFEAVAFATPTGEISDVFSTPFGYHILKVEARKQEDGQEKLQVRHILLRVEASPTTIRQANDRMDDFYDAMADGANFQAAASSAGLTVESTPPFESGRPIPGIGLLGRAERFAFSSPVGAVSPDPIQDTTALYAFRVAEKLPAGLLPYDQVRDRVEADALADRKRELARSAMDAAISSGDGSLESIASALGADVQETGLFSRESFVPSVGRRNAFVATAFSLAAEVRSDMVETDRGFYVMVPVERQEADEAAFAEQRDQLRQQILMEKRQLLIAAWLESIITDAEVIDYRSGPEGVRWHVDPDVLYYSTGA